MSRPSIEPITEVRLDAVANFLHQHLNSARSPAVWASDFRRSQRPESPNLGFCLLDGDCIVGVIGALYADRLRDGRTERLCNITSWCVLPTHRQHSTRLAMAVIGQGDRSYTDFSPTKVVAATLKFLKFTELDGRRAVSLNLPRWSVGIELKSRPDAIVSSLDGQARQSYEDHRHLPWLHHLVLAHGERRCHVIYKLARVRGIPAARVLHADNPVLYRMGAGRLATHWWRRGLPLSVVDLRLVPSPPVPLRIQSGFTPKVVRAAPGLSANIDYLYSETLLFDLT